MRLRRALRAAVIGVLALAVTACAGLPTNGSINAGLEVGIDTSLDLTFVPDGPTPGASPEDIVDGFLEAGTSPAGEWAIARQFLAPELAETWHPEAAVTIDRWVTRSVTSEIQPSDEEAAVQVSLTPVASVDAAGAYTESSGRSSETPFELARNDEGSGASPPRSTGSSSTRRTSPRCSGATPCSSSMSAGSTSFPIHAGSPGAGRSRRRSRKR
ncbi:hypothetical protein [Microbacterium sp. NIBRBAC000506063]|uniref:hypothetical protein n=1 Tax=Microbacterium sp. NIBRBAC000506063 TaxID=2734618 RepID=UPI001BB5D1DA|nr:hypothetical protein [Microbacterium sp. NIBRBAC000506063]QTV79415.1 hypothetical protein KAE78_10785 [Microbacterium sp. NIBRBAC000506063]